MPNPIPFLPLHTLEPGQVADCYALLVAKSHNVTKSGKPYFNCQFRDAHRSVACLLWPESPFLRDCVDDWQPGTAYKLRVVYQEHPVYGSQVELHDWWPIKEADRAAGFDPASLVPTSRFPPEEMWRDLLELVEKELSDLPLRTLVLNLLQRWQPLLLKLPASESRYYPIVGGWLEHTLSLSRSCLLLADHYQRHYEGQEPKLNRDLLLAGAVLHDLGRVVELKPTLPGLPPEPTVPGKLFGHVLLARDLVRDAATHVEGLAPDVLERLEHLILSHLTLPEWGSPRLPLVPEVLILHHADDLDAKLEMYLRCLRLDTTAGPFTQRDPILNKPLLKPGPWPEARVVPPLEESVSP